MLNPLAFDELAGGGEDVWIACSGQVYRLRRTKLEKLILTK
jgi:hemin uptake protein HemP